MVDRLERRTDPQLEHVCPDSELLLYDPRMAGGNRVRVMEFETLASAQFQIIGRRQRLAEFLQFVLEAHRRKLRRLSGHVTLESRGAVGQILIDFAQQALAQRKPDQAAEKAERRDEHKRIPDGKAEADRSFAPQIRAPAGRSQCRAPYESVSALAYPP